MSATLLCALADIPDGGAKAFGDDTASSLFAVRRGDQVHVYQNRCPHAHTPLNWMPDRFLNRDRSQIICATHGALFDIDTGYCTAGPCQGQHLTAKTVTVQDGQVWLS